MRVTFLFFPPQVPDKANSGQPHSSSDAQGTPCDGPLPLVLLTALLEFRIRGTLSWVWGGGVQPLHSRRNLKYKKQLVKEAYKQKRRWQLANYHILLADGLEDILLEVF